MSRTNGGFRKGLGVARSLGMDWAIRSNGDKSAEPELAGVKPLPLTAAPKPLRPPLGKKP